MKKLLVILIIIASTTMVLSSNELNEKDEINFYIGLFNMQKITYQGVQGFFIPFTGYIQLVNILNDYVYQKQLNQLLQAEIKQLDIYRIRNIRLKTAFAISISICISEIFLCGALSILCYNLARF